MTKKKVKQLISKVVTYFINNFYNIPISNKNNVFYFNIFENSYILKPYIQLYGGKNITIKKNTKIGLYSWISAIDSYEGVKYYPSINIGENVNIGNFFCMTAINKITIEDECLISERVYISDHSHVFDINSNTPFFKQSLFSKGEIRIGKGCFIGLGVSILPNVTLGKNCIVAANSVVNMSFPDYSMIAGVPARIIKKYSVEEKKWIKIE